MRLATFAPEFRFGSVPTSAAATMLALLTEADRGDGLSISDSSWLLVFAIAILPLVPAPLLATDRGDGLNTSE